MSAKRDQLSSISIASTSQALHPPDSEPKSSFSPTTPTQKSMCNVFKSNNVDVERGTSGDQPSTSRFRRASRWVMNAFSNFGGNKHTHNYPSDSKDSFLDVIIDLPTIRPLNINKKAPSTAFTTTMQQPHHHHCKACERQESQKKTKRIWILLLLLLLLLLLGNSIFLNVRVLNAPKPPSTTSTATSTSTSTSTAPIITSTPSLALQTCLTQFQTLAPSPSFSCSSCVPILLAVPNDLSPNTMNPQTTGQGNALQFCALQEIAQATSGNVLQNVGWLKDTSVCTWQGVSCDASGRVVDLTLIFPGVPASLASSLAQTLPFLQTLSITGNSQLPGGSVPSGLFSLPTLQSLSITSTALKGPLNDNCFVGANNLTRVSLVDNAMLGGTVPSGLWDLPLTELVIRNQSLSSPLPASLPPTLTLLDFSSNSIPGTLPPFPQSLIELHLDSNALTTLPANYVFPPSLQILTISNNPGLEGDVPQGLCLSSTLSNCDFRGTELMSPSGAAPTTGSCGVCLYGAEP